MSGMGRREFVALLGGAAAWPVAARAQQPAMPVIGFLDIKARLKHDRETRLRAFRQGPARSRLCRRARTLSIEYRWAHGE